MLYLPPMPASTARRTPVQRRSRERVERILVAAEQIVVKDGVDALSTRAVATRADVPVATLYQYFADRDAIIVALIERHVEAMDDRLAAAIAGLERYSVRSLVDVVVQAYVAGYRKRPSFVVLWFQGRVNPEIDEYIRQRTVRIAAGFRDFTVSAGLLSPETEPLALELAGEMIDAFMRVAYRAEVHGDQRIVAEGTEMIASYLERFATPLGMKGIDATDLQAVWAAQE
jgi:AcrR family transcriptional regulator